MAAMARSESAPADTIAAFDFDHTLLNGDTLILLQRHCRRQPQLIFDWIRLAPALLLWLARLRSTAWFKERFLCHLFAGISTQERSTLLPQVLTPLLMQNLRHEARERLNWHRHQGHRLFIVSASPRQLLQTVADQLGATLLATETSDLLSHSAETPLRLQSANCKGPEKVLRLEAALGRPLSSVCLHAYGDSRGDRELLLAADHPHWRSFEPREVPYPERRPLPWLPLISLALLLALGWGLGQLPSPQRQALLQALARLPLWLPALYGFLAMAFLLRYCRWRLLLSSQGIGRWGLADAHGWFRGFALTATPGKLGELSRVQHMHQQLGYPRAPIVQAFVAERLLDVLAVTIWLTVLAPAALAPLGHRLRGATTALADPPGLVPAMILAMVAVSGLALLLAKRAPLRQRRLRQTMARLRPRSWIRLLPSLLSGTAISLLIWASEPMILWLLVQAISPRTISPGVAMAIYMISGTAGMASALPGGIGVNEGATMMLLSQQGVPLAPALSIAIIRRLITPWSVVALAGAISGFRPRPGKL
jgi:HAD superfamily hydrolase (TIGR01490 family)